MATDSMYLENLEEYVNDEGKIITYKWLSLNLHVHVNEAKQMLYTFVEQQRKKKEKLTATYFVSGLSKPVNGFQVYTCTVIPEEELESYKNSLSTVHSVHVYSVQKASLKDSNSLYLADYDCVKENLFDIHKYSSIKYGKAKPTSDVKRPLTKPVKEEPKVNGATSSTAANGHATASKTKKDSKKAGIAGMFANASKKTEDSSSKTTEDRKTEDHKPETEAPSMVAKQDKKQQKESKKGGVMNFFANHTGKKGVPKSEEVQKKESRMEDERKKDSQPKQNGKGKRLKKTRDADSDEEGNKKKRRRIRMEMSDSSDEEMEYESPAPSPVPSPTREPSPVPDTPEKESPKKEENSVKPVQNGERHRVHRRKLVPKTFMDDDGFMVTEKVWESESTDASDTEPPPVKDTPKAASPQKKKASPKKKSPPSTGSRKQMSISSFFVKK